MASYVFGLESVGPDSFEQVAQSGDERVVFNSGQRHLAVTQFESLAAHFAYQQPFRLRLALLQSSNHQITLNSV